MYERHVLRVLIYGSYHTYLCEWKLYKYVAKNEKRRNSKNNYGKLHFRILHFYVLTYEFTRKYTQSNRDVVIQQLYTINK